MYSGANRMDKIYGFLVKLFILAITYMEGIKHLYHVMFALIALDFFTGLWKCVQRNGWNSFKSRTAKRSVIKIGAYSIAIAATFFIEKEIIGSGIYITRAVTGFIAMVEAASIFENLAEITGNNVFLKIFNLLKTSVNTNKNIINKIDTTKEDEENSNTDI